MRQTFRAGTALAPNLNCIPVLHPLSLARLPQHGRESIHGRTRLRGGVPPGVFSAFLVLGLGTGTRACQPWLT